MCALKKQNDSSEKQLTMWTSTLDEAQIAALGKICAEGNGFEATETPYAIFSYKSKPLKINVTVYTSKKIVVAGKGTQEFVQNVIEPQVTGVARLGYDDVYHPEWFEYHAGLDESGKGDLFGPLVSCCVIAGAEAVKIWIDAGVRDFEPRSALVPGPEGMEHPRAVEEAARLLLKPGGLFLMEHGWLQGAACRELCHKYFWSDVHTGLDLAGKDRFLFAVRTEKK